MINTAKQSHLSDMNVATVPDYESQQFYAAKGFYAQEWWISNFGQVALNYSE